MKVSELIKQLQRFDGEAEVAIYNSASGGALWIPGYEPEQQISVDSEFAEEYELPAGTVFIHGK